MRSTPAWPACASPPPQAPPSAGVEGDGGAEALARRIWRCDPLRQALGWDTEGTKRTAAVRVEPIALDCPQAAGMVTVELLDPRGVAYRGFADASLGTLEGFARYVAEARRQLALAREWECESTGPLTPPS